MIHLVLCTDTILITVLETHITMAVDLDVHLTMVDMVQLQFLPLIRGVSIIMVATCSTSLELYEQAPLKIVPEQVMIM